MCGVDPTAQTSIQERLYPWMTCFVCGPANDRGLRLRSYSNGDEVVGEFRPWPEHDNGLGFLNGGIIAALLDCHTGAAVFAEADRRGWRPLAETVLPFVTAGIDLRYRRPTPLLETLELWSKVETASENEIHTLGEVRFDGKVCARATTTWKRWRPR